MAGEEDFVQISQKERPLPRQDPKFGPVGDLFAPFFDVVFYTPSSEVGQIAKLEEQANLAARDPKQRARAAKLRAQISKLLGKQQAALERTDTLNQSRIELRSVGGGLQSYSPAGQKSALGQLVKYRANLQITMLSAAALQATLTLTPPYADAIEIIDHRLIKFGSIMEIQWGYLSRDGRKPAVSDKGLFRITQPSIKFGKQVTVTIGGFDILSSSLQTTDTRCQWLRADYPCDLDIVRTIVEKRVGEGAKLDDSKLSKKSPLRKRKPGKGVTQTDPDWAFFRRLIRQNNCTFTQMGGTVSVMDENRVDEQKPKYRLLWFKKPENETDVPMITFETNPILSLFAGARGSRGQRTICRDPKSKKVIVIDKDPANTGETHAGECATATTDKSHKKDVTKTSQGTVGVFANMDKACTSGRYFTQPCKRPNQREETNRENNEIRMFYNTRASAVCPGVPGLLPQQLVEIRDVGKTFSGNYRVMKVVHTIGKGYTMKLDLLRAASSNVKGEGDASSSDKCNKKTADPKAVKGKTVEPKVIQDGKPDAGCIVAESKPQARAKADAAKRKAKGTT